MQCYLTARSFCCYILFVVDKNQETVTLIAMISFFLKPASCLTEKRRTFCCLLTVSVHKGEMDEFASLDVLLLAYGCKVFRENCLITFLNTVFLITIIVCYIATPLISIESQLYENQRFPVLGMIDRYSDELFGFIVIYFLRKHRRTLKNLLMTISASLTSPQQTSLRRHAVSSLVIVILIVVQKCLFTAYHVTRPSITHLHAIGDCFRTYHSLNSWFIGGCLTFTFLVKIIKFNEVNYFEQLERDEGIMVEENAPRLALDRWKCMHFRASLLKPFSIIPCLWFIHLFIKGSAVFMLVGHVEGIVGKVSRILPLVYQLLAVTYVIYHCDTCTVMTKKRIHDTIMGMMRKNQMQGMDLFVTRLDSSGEGITMFKRVALNRRFFLAFACSLVSFVFLFREVTDLVRGDQMVTEPPITLNTTIPLTTPIPTILNATSIPAIFNDNSTTTEVMNITLSL